MYVTEIRNPKSHKFLGEVLDYGATGTVTTSPIQPGASTSDSRDTYLVKQLHALAVAIYQAKQRNDRVGVENLMVHFRRLADEYRERGAIGVSPFDKIIIETGEWLKQVPAALQTVSFGVLKGIWPLLLAGAATMYVARKL